MDETNKDAALEAARARVESGRPVTEKEESKPVDAVNHPPHYTFAKFEVYEVIKAFELGFNLGNVVKYILRHPHKGGLEDLKKARWYLDREIEEWEEGR